MILPHCHRSRRKHPALATGGKSYKMDFNFKVKFFDSAEKMTSPPRNWSYHWVLAFNHVCALPHEAFSAAHSFPAETPLGIPRQQETKTRRTAQTNPRPPTLPPAGTLRDSKATPAKAIKARPHPLQTVKPSMYGIANLSRT